MLKMLTSLTRMVTLIRHDFFTEELESNFGDEASDFGDDNNASVYSASINGASSIKRRGWQKLPVKSRGREKVSRLLKDDALKKSRKVREIAKQLRVLERKSACIYEEKMIGAIIHCQAPRAGGRIRRSRSAI